MGQRPNSRPLRDLEEMLDAFTPGANPTSAPTPLPKPRAFSDANNSQPDPKRKAAPPSLLGLGHPGSKPTLQPTGPAPGLPGHST